MDDNNRSYTNGEITVNWKPGLCNHSGICFTRLIEVFNPRKRPWVNLEGASTEKIIETVDKCPTDALTWQWNDASKHLKEDKKNKTEEKKSCTIQVMRDGPIVAEGDFKVIDSFGNELKAMKMVSFCRCGHSNNLPFCDGTHRKVGFSEV
jgi:uncharacterized Fe-S cluster protein YjdI